MNVVKIFRNELLKILMKSSRNWVMSFKFLRFLIASCGFLATSGWSVVRLNFRAWDWFIFVNEATKEGANEDEGDHADERHQCIMPRSRDVSKESILFPSYVDVPLDHHLLLCEPTSPRLQSLKIEWDDWFLANWLPAIFQCKLCESFKSTLALVLATLCWSF